MSLEEKILSALSEEKELDTLQISKKVIGPPGVQKDVNPTLYRLLKEDQIKKLPPKSGSRPSWSLN
ncbi:hypothetical protein LCGC14_2878010 [marine sediment metagenome]|uniref:Z-binding domain-containing protein n=2 Tax=root TaxID=1 RepID=A0A0F8Y168_9ZZZZ|nr:MAG: helix-turn-helix domain protein [Marseillevirus LCMAC202]